MSSVICLPSTLSMQLTSYVFSVISLLFGAKLEGCCWVAGWLGIGALLFWEGAGGWVENVGVVAVGPLIDCSFGVGYGSFVVPQLYKGNMMEAATTIIQATYLLNKWLNITIPLPSLN